MKPATVNSELNALSAVLTYARRLNVPCASPKISRCPTTKKKGRVRFFSRAEVGFILAAAKIVAPTLFPLVVFLFETGARKSEALNLPWANVDFEQAMVRIWSETDDDGGDDDDAEPEEGGNEEEEAPEVSDRNDSGAYLVKSIEREVPLSDRLLAVLKEQRAKGLSIVWVFPVWKNNGGTKGERYVNFPKHTWTRILAKATELARQVNPKARTIKGGPHKARHTFASHLLSQKPDLYLLGRLLGHTHARVTELYSHLLPEHLAEARNVVSFDCAS